MESRTIYIAGPMTGIAEHNFPAFFEAEKLLVALGWSVRNPARTDDGDTSKPWDYYMRIDLGHILASNCVALLPGWQKSKGVALELTVARALKMDVYELIGGKLEPLPEETVCQEADRLVSVDRQDSYGHPRSDFARTARIWSGVLMEKLRPGAEISPQDVGLCMIGVKLSRHTHSPKRDNMVDAAGYAKCVSLIDAGANPAPRPA